MRRVLLTVISVVFFFFITLFVSPSRISAHCDTLDGPVVSAARRALDTENANYVLIWVKPESEEIRKALKRARKKRAQARSKEEKDKADMKFFETLVKVHREGEGTAYEGIKPAGSVEPEIALADKAIKSGKLDKVLVNISSDKSKEIIRHLFHKLNKRAKYEVDDLVSGRKFIESYVQFIHSVERAIKDLEVSEEAHHH